MRHLIIVLMLLALRAPGAGEPTRDASSLRAKDVRFLDFKAGTLYGLTPESIKTRFNITSLVWGHEKDLLDILQGATGPGRLSYGAIRMRVELESGSVYLVDQKGVVQGPDGEHQLDGEHFRRLRWYVFTTCPAVSTPE